MSSYNNIYYTGPSSDQPNGMPAKEPIVSDILPESDREKLELFYGSRFCVVHLARCSVQVYQATGGDIGVVIGEKNGKTNGAPSEKMNIGKSDSRRLSSTKKLSTEDSLQWKLVANGALVLQSHLDRELPGEITAGTLRVCHLPTCESNWTLPLTQLSTYSTDTPATVHLVYTRPSGPSHNPPTSPPPISSKVSSNNKKSANDKSPHLTISDNGAVGQPHVSVIDKSQADLNSVYRIHFGDLSSAISFQTHALGLLDRLKHGVPQDGKERKRAIKALAKTQRSTQPLSRDTISTPCLFRHVTTLADLAISGPPPHQY